ncbi:DoxX family protein [Pannonibacter sp. SL95]|uniref:DoxX family protein n=1 Tax=Pannonibacter sp. SL95 TaxID=2995153 RepID=UPI002274531E|nr:DoxX family protein [Pannonibacter sp. SL95]MCY1707110.1 DoxX family protein [Pannonibacter sp. SL95]
MTQTALNEIAAFLLRVALGIMFLAHSLLLKLFVFTLPGTAQFFVTIGLPGWLAYVIFTVEAIAGLFLILGVQTRWVALAMVPVLAGATWAHWGNGWMFGYPDGGWEYPAYLTVLAIVQGLVGDGRFAVWPSLALGEGSADLGHEVRS